MKFARLANRRARRVVTRSCRVGCTKVTWLGNGSSTRIWFRPNRLALQVAERTDVLLQVINEDSSSKISTRGSRRVFWWP